MFSVDLVFKQELNRMLEISVFQSRCGGLKLRGTNYFSKVLDLQSMAWQRPELKVKEQSLKDNAEYILSLFGE